MSGESLDGYGVNRSGRNARVRNVATTLCADLLGRLAVRVSAISLSSSDTFR
jgi:hypothetical protein